MQDLTTGSLTRHLLKTTSFMLVSMVFQTLYVLVDLYWVGRLGTEAVAAVGIAGNLMFIVLAATQMLGVGTTTLVSHAAGRKDRERAILVFNQSQVLSIVVGVLFLVVAMALRMRVCARAQRRRRDGAVGRGLSALVHSRDGAAVRAGRHGRRAARHGQLQAGHGGADRDRHPQHRAGAGADLWLGHRPAAWRRGRGDRDVHRDCRRRRLDDAVLLPADAYLKFTPADWKPRLPALGRHAEDRPAGRRGVRADGRVPRARLRGQPAVRRRRAGGLRHRHAHRAGVLPAGRRARLRRRAGGRPELRRAARRRACARRSRPPRRSPADRCSCSRRSSGCWADDLVRVFSSDPQAIAVGEEYLRIVAWNFVASGVIFVSSSMFQAMGNTMPSLVTSFTRIVLVAVPVLLLAQTPGFELRWVWYISVGGGGRSAGDEPAAAEARVPACA